MFSPSGTLSSDQPNPHPVSIILMIKRPASSAQVLLLYDELNSGRNAMEILQPIGVALGEDMELEFEIWNFGAIRIPSVAEDFGEALQQADILAVAAREDRPLPGFLLEAIRKSLPEGAGRSTALVGILIDPGTWPRIRADSANLKSLRALSESGNFTLFTQELFQQQAASHAVNS